MKNRKVIYLYITILLTFFFITSYSIYHYMNRNDLKLETYGSFPYVRLNSTEGNETLRKTTVTSNSNLPKVLEGSKFSFNIIYKDNKVKNLVLEKLYNKSSVLNGKTQMELDEFFKNQGFITQSMTNSEIIFVNNSDSYSYSANRFFLGAYKDLVTIYKTDKDGNIAQHKLFNASVHTGDGKPKKYDFEVEDTVDVQYVKLEDLKGKDGIVESLIHGKKHTKEDDTIEDVEEGREYEKWEFKTPDKAFDFARSLLGS